MSLNVLSSLPGRLRIHIPGVCEWRSAGERRIAALPGVKYCQVNPYTQNCLLHYDPDRVEESALLGAISGFSWSSPPADAAELRPRPRVFQETVGRLRRLRIPVAGLDRDPQLARRVVERLEQRPGVKATANPLTGRVLVEFAAHVVEAAEVVAEVAHLDQALCPLPGEDSPQDPLDPQPLYRSAMRTLGATLGLGFVVARKLMGHSLSPDLRRTALRTAATLGIAQSFPKIRAGLQSTLGRTGADALLYAPMLFSLAFSEGILGLILTGAEASVLLREVLARRRNWNLYEARLGDAPSVHAGAVLRIESGQRLPGPAQVMEGHGSTVTLAGEFVAVRPSDQLSAGSRLQGGPFVVELLAQTSQPLPPRPASPATATEQYIARLNLFSLGYAALQLLISQSPWRALESLMLVNPRPALIGTEMANIAADSRAMRSGLVMVGSRPNRHVRKPDVVVLECPRMLVDSYRLTAIVRLNHDSPEEILAQASGISLACGSPWGTALPVACAQQAEEGLFEHGQAIATLGGRQVCLRIPPGELVERWMGRRLEGGDVPLLLERGKSRIGILLLRPRMHPKVERLRQMCVEHGIDLVVWSHELHPHGRQPQLAHKAQVRLEFCPDRVETIRRWQAEGKRVLYASDHMASAEAFWASDLSVGLSAGRGSRFPGRADFLAPDLSALVDLLEAGVRREKAARDAVIFSLLANAAGAVQGLRTAVGLERASLSVYVASLAALGNVLWRLRGGQRRSAVSAQWSDPRPERWGRRSLPACWKAVSSQPGGLTHEVALARRESQGQQMEPSRWLSRLGAQLSTPMSGILGAAGVVALLAEAPLDFVFIAATLGLNVCIGLWQEMSTGKAQESLMALAAPRASLVRDGQPCEVEADEVVVGDVLLLTPGQRLVGDARVLESNGLELEESTLTGEAHPVRKFAETGFPPQRVVLAGSDVVAGRGLALVFAVGRQTRLGATTAALSLDPGEGSPLGQKMNQLFQGYMPLSIAGGAIVTLAGMARLGWSVHPLITGASIALAAIPEGLPLLSGVGEAIVARRLADRGATVRKLSAVEALGRVTVACCDKTGTLTEGRLRLVEVYPEGEELLAKAALACPASAQALHPTDLALLEGARSQALTDPCELPRSWELPFSSSRGFHATWVQGSLYAKGAPERLLPYCTLTHAESQNWLRQAEAMASRGLRVLLVASGACQQVPQNGLEVALQVDGLVGLCDPLRANAPTAVRQCLQAGIRLLMLTGDHPKTARAIAAELGMQASQEQVLTAAELSDMSDGQVDQALKTAVIVARATPLDKLRIIESLQRQGEIVAMTGDGVNDAPALKLADVGVAMGQSGSQSARQAADVILQRDDFATLVEALIEGRFFWRNMRRSLSLLLGGNLGELSLVVVACLLGHHAPLTTRQILAVNLITDALPAMSVLLQKPHRQELSQLALEGQDTWDGSLRRAVLHRGLATSIPALLSYGAVWRLTGNLSQARTQAFVAIVATQLAQTVDAGRGEGRLSPGVLAASSASLAMLGMAMAVPLLRGVLELTPLPGINLGISVAASLGAVLIGRSLQHT